jgi:hypothetical protein
MPEVAAKMRPAVAAVLFDKGFPMIYQDLFTILGLTLAVLILTFNLMR